MFGFPWPQSHIEAFQIYAAELQSGRAKGNASELARTILEQSMFSYLGTERARELGILNPWDKTAPEPRILEFYLKFGANARIVLRLEVPCHVPHETKGELANGPSEASKFRCTYNLVANAYHP